MKHLKEDVRTALPKLHAHHYGVIYVDPPWDAISGGKNSYTPTRGGHTYRSFNTTAPKYTLMSTKRLVELADQVRRVAKTDSHLYLWTVNKTMPDAARIVEAYGYRWVSIITWDKGRPGVAKYFQGMTEHCVFAVRGSPPYRFDPATKKMAQGRTLISEKRTDHSRKPEMMRAMIERVSAGPYLELFARRCPKNWDAVGLELEATK